MAQRYFFLAELVELMPEIIIVVHDDACHLRKFAGKRAADSEVARRLAYPQIQYIIDHMHSRGHVDPWCLENCIATAPCNVAALEGVNTSVDEQMFSRLARHKFAVRWMDKLTGAMFLIEMAEVRNSRWLRAH